ncbi:hypothetical protein U1Q18_010144 [Sarracenia purpurea var. burkii]
MGRIGEVLTKRKSNRSKKPWIYGILTEDLLDVFNEVFGHRSRAHDLHDLDHVVNGDVTGVLDVLGLLVVAFQFFEGFDDLCGGGGDGEGGEGGGRRTDAEL